MWIIDYIKILEDIKHTESHLNKKEKNTESQRHN